MPNKFFQLVVFDMAGTTIVDKSNVAKAFLFAMKKHGYPIEVEQANRVMGYKKLEAIRDLLTTHYPEAIPHNAGIVAAIHQSFDDAIVGFYQSVERIAPMPHAERVFATLKEAQVKVALNTGFSQHITQIILERVGWQNHPLIDAVVSSDQVTNGRPYPEMIEYLMQQTGMKDPSKVVKVGDTEVDVAEGKRAGCGLVVAVTTGSFTREQLEPYTPDAIIDDLQDLPGLLQNAFQFHE